ncbi:hypothetical protein M011DRAFT_468465, partial [Sporormia fimetaria CBS 119925]
CPALRLGDASIAHTPPKSQSLTCEGGRWQTIPLQLSDISARQTGLTACNTPAQAGARS